VLQVDGVVHVQCWCVKEKTLAELEGRVISGRRRPADRRESRRWKKSTADESLSACEDVRYHRVAGSSIASKQEDESSSSFFQRPWRALQTQVFPGLTGNDRSALRRDYQERHRHGFRQKPKPGHFPAKWRCSTSGVAGVGWQQGTLIRSVLYAAITDLLQQT